MGKLATAAMLGATGMSGVALRCRVVVAQEPVRCPYNQRCWVQAPHLFITRERLLGILEARPGELVLEIGPGTGYYTLHVARAVMPEGTLEILDLQQEMLDHTMRRATEAGIDNLVPRQGDATELPFAD